MQIPASSGALTVRRLIALVVGPFVVITLLLLLLGNGLHHFPVVIANSDTGIDAPNAGHVSIPENLIKALDSRAVSVTLAGTPAEAQSMYDNGSAGAMIVFPADLSKNMMMKQQNPGFVIPGKITVSVAGSNPLTKLMLFASIGSSVLKAMPPTGSPLSADILPVPVDISSVIGGLSAAPLYILVALLGFVCWALTGIFSLLAAGAVRRLREERAAAGGSLASGGRVLGAATFVVSFAVAGWVLFLALVSVTGAIIGVSLPAAVYGASFVLLLLFAAASAIGFAAANLLGHRSSRSAFPYLVLPIFLGGFLFPAALLPTWLQWLPWIFPPAYGIDAALQIATSNHTTFLPWAVILTAVWVIAFFALGLIGLGRQARTSAKPATT